MVDGGCVFYASIHCGCRLFWLWDAGVNKSIVQFGMLLSRVSAGRRRQINILFQMDIKFTDLRTGRGRDTHNLDTGGDGYCRWGGCINGDWLGWRCEHSNEEPVLWVIL